MNVGLIFLGIMFIFIIVASIVLYIIYKRITGRTKTKVNIINDDNTITVQTFTNISESFNIGDDEKYVFDINAVVKRKHYFEIFYFRNVPTPIRFDIGTHKPTVTSKNLKTVMENGLLAELFGNGTFSFDNIMLTVAVVLSGVGVLMLVLMYTQGVTLKASPENIEIITTAIKSVIGG